MSTEYRRGIPSTAHVEAATRLGLLFDDDAPFATQARRQFSADDAGLSFRPIRPDGAPVDWDVLDQEVARVGQQGQPQTMACNLTAFALQGFRADLWQRIRAYLADGSGCGLPDVSSLDSMGFRVQSPFFDAEVLWPQGTNPADILARWTVYQELKPLYDLVDGAQGEAAMPRDVVTEWARQARGGENIRPDWELVRTPEGLLGRTTNRQGVIFSWSDSENWLGQPLRNFAAVLDAVAERRVAERMRGQAPANPDAVLTVTSERRVNVEPRRFADVRPDRHGWRWWLVGAENSDDGLFGVAEANRRICVQNGRFYWLDRSHVFGEFTNLDHIWNRRTVIPTDEQGNPVSWEAAGFAAEAVRSAQESVQRAANDATPGRSVGDIEWTVMGQPVTRDMTVEPATGMVRSTHTARIRQLDRFVTEAIQAGNTGSFSTESPTPPHPGQFSNNPATPPLTPEGFRRAASLDTLNREAEQHGVPGIHITGGTGAKPSVPAQSIEVPAPTPSRFALIEIDDADPTAERIRQEQEAERQRLAELRQRLATERAAPQEMAKESEVSRFDLIEPDPQADPAASIRAWEARQAAAKVRPVAVPPRIAKPAAAPHRPTIEVVDAEVDGLSRSEAFAALFGRALNGGC